MTSVNPDLPVWCSVISMILTVFTIVFGLAINIILIIVILQKKQLRTYMNVYFINLSISDIIICCLTLIIRSSMFIYRQGLPHSVYRLDLFLQTLTDVVRMFLLVGISFERHQAIAAPFSKGPSGKYRTIAGLVLSWCISLILAIACAILYENSLTFVFTGISAPRDEETEIYFILPITVICLGIITVCYLLMFRHLYNHGKKMTNMKKKKARISPEATSKIRPAIQTVSQKIDTESNKEQSDKKDSNINMMQDKSKTTEQPTTSPPEQYPKLKHKIIKNVSVHEMDGTVHNEDVVVEKNQEIVGAVCVLNSKNRVLGKRRVEMRAAKRVALVMGIFLLLWLPFPIAGIICKSVSDIVISCRSVLALLACISSLTTITNPLLYVLTNKQLKSVTLVYLQSLLKCKIKQ